MSRQERKSLLEVMWSRIKKRPPQQVTPAPSSPARAFQAVSIFGGANPCPTSRQLRDHRFLAKDAPPLPLAGCAHPNTCECRYLKHKDRRTESRRFGGDIYAMRRDFTVERRKRRGRRAGD
jgi:hypothetical protein